MKAFNIFAYLALTAAVAAHPADQPANKAILGHPTAVTAQPTPVVNLESDATGAYVSLLAILIFNSLQVNNLTIEKYCISTKEDRLCYWGT